MELQYSKRVAVCTRRGRAGPFTELPRSHQSLDLPKGEESRHCTQIYVLSRGWVRGWHGRRVHLGDRFESVSDDGIQA